MNEAVKATNIQSAEPIIEHSRTVQHFEPWLTLYGLRIIFERNR